MSEMEQQNIYDQLPTSQSLNVEKKECARYETPQQVEFDVRKQTPLRHRWVLWYTHKSTSRNQHENYAEKIRPVATFGTIEEFWRVYAHVIRPSKMAIATDYHLFKEGITPLWEDVKNKEGGKFMLRIKKTCTNRLWEMLLLNVIGEQLGPCGDNINGIVVSLRFQEDIIAMWSRSGDRAVKQESNKGIYFFIILTNFVVFSKFFAKLFCFSGCRIASVRV